MHSATQPHYYGSDNMDTPRQENGGDFIMILVICFAIAIVCAFPGGFTNNSSNKSN